MSASGFEVAPPRRRRRVWPWVLLGVLVLLVCGVFAADGLLRDWAEKRIATEVSAGLAAPSGGVVAHIGGGPVVFQVLRGTLDEVEVAIDELQLGPLTGDAVLTARGIPLDESAPTDTVTVRYAVSESSLSAAAPVATGATIETVQLEGDEVVASGTISVFGATLALGVGLTPSAVDGDLAFDPTSIRVGDASYTADQIGDVPLIGGLASGLLQQRTVCIADALPAVLTLTDLRVAGPELVATLDASGVVLAGDDFSERGVCPA